MLEEAAKLRWAILLSTVQVGSALYAQLPPSATSRRDAIDRLRRAQTLSAFDYSYDPVGNRTQAVEVLESTSTTIDYVYDPLYRLTAADYSSGEFFHYSYDEVGNRLTQQTLAGTNSYTYDAPDRLIDRDGVAFTWDATGNLLSDGLRSYAYDHANRLTQVVQGLDTYTFTYNWLGDRTA